MIKCLVVVIATVAIGSWGVVQAQQLNYLEPIPPFDQKNEGYQQLVFRTLITDRWPILWMLVPARWGKECALVMNEIETDDSVHTGHYELEYAVVAQTIWESRDTGNGFRVSGPRKDIRVIRKTIPIPDSAAAILRRTWVAVLKQTHYPRKSVARDVGVAYLFYVRESPESLWEFPELFGMTWNPESGIPLDMVDLGNLLMQHVTKSQLVKSNLLPQVLELCKKIQSEVDSQVKME